MTDDEFKVIEERNTKLVLENRHLRNEVDMLRKEKQLLYNHFIRLKDGIEYQFDLIGKTYFADDFYED